MRKFAKLVSIYDNSNFFPHQIMNGKSNKKEYSKCFTMNLSEN